MLPILFSVQDDFEARYPSDMAWLSRARKVLGEAGMEEMFKTPIEAAVVMDAVQKADFHRVTFVERIRVQKPEDKDKLYPIHAPETECISEGKSRNPCAFGVTSTALQHQQGSIISALAFPANQQDGNTRAERFEQTTNPLLEVRVKFTAAIVDLGFRGVDYHAPAGSILCVRSRTMRARHHKRLELRQAVEPVIEHSKADHQKDCCWLYGAERDSIHTVVCAAGFNLPRLSRTIARHGLLASCLSLIAMANGRPPHLSTSGGRKISDPRFFMLLDEFLHPANSRRWLKAPLSWFSQLSTSKAISSFNVDDCPSNSRVAWTLCVHS